ncbi:MAG: phospholipase/lecithinase/hemolysin [Phycisphaerales bacterium]|nr:phospholipase/lecithinase/hemolysin [Phycisphaerales bacterium]
MFTRTRGAVFAVATFAAVTSLFILAPAAARGGLTAVVPSAQPAAPVMPVAAGALGDSLVDEYQFATDTATAGGDRRTAKNFVEILAETGRINVGTFTTADRGEPRLQGYERNWGRSGARTIDLTPQVAGLASQAAAGQVALAFVEVGGNDFRDLASALAAGDPSVDPASATTAALARTVGSAQALLAANSALRVVVGNVPDITLTPGAQLALSANPALAPAFAQVSGAIDQYNAVLAAQLSADPRVAVADVNAALKAVVAAPSAAVPGVVIDPLVPSSDPTHLFVDLIHPGTVGSALLANAFIDAADTAFDMGIDPLTASDIRAASGLGGGGPSAVPLPPAGWVGLMTLGGMAAAEVRRRRRAA